MRRLWLTLRTKPTRVLLCLLALSWPRTVTAQRIGDEKHAGRSGHAHNASAVPAGPISTDLGTLIRTGWVQIIRFESPVGAKIEIASSSGAVEVIVPGDIGLALGRDYRLRVSDIPNKPGLSMYPTIRLIGYLAPPAGVDPARYPIPVHFLESDLEEASVGRLVSNVVYLEDPNTALPIAFPSHEVPIVEIAPGDDPLRRGSDLGRPMIFIQLGNRVPIDGSFGDPALDPPVYFAPAAVQGADVQIDSTVQPAAWPVPLGPTAGAMHGLIARPSTPACSPNMPGVRLPYKVHPRMGRDECVSDGGDAVPYAHFTGHDQIAGLSASETAAQFSRPGERPRLVTSNQVCLYAPRFGLVRSSSVTIAGVYAEGTRSVDHRVRRAAVQSRIATELNAQSDQARFVRRRERLSSIASNEAVSGLDELRIIAAVVKEQPYDDVTGHTGPNAMEQAADARIAMSIEAARAWNRDQFPAYTATVEGSGEVASSMLTGSVQQIREPYRRPGDLVLWKTVTPTSAKQGDIVEFAIYYRNTGQRVVENVSIIDSLTARLEYVANSAQTDRRAVFTAAPNEVESHELRWDISDPVAGGQGGVVWFKAMVR